MTVINCGPKYYAVNIRVLIMKYNYENIANQYGFIIQCIYFITRILSLKLFFLYLPPSILIKCVLNPFTKGIQTCKFCITCLINSTGKYALLFTYLSNTYLRAVSTRLHVPDVSQVCLK